MQVGCLLFLQDSSGMRQELVCLHHTQQHMQVHYASGRSRSSGTMSVEYIAVMTARCAAPRDKHDVVCQHALLPPAHSMMLDAECMLWHVAASCSSRLCAMRIPA
jgi:hypothetical protein